MKEEQLSLFKQALSRIEVTEQAKEFLFAVSMTLSGHTEVFRKCYLAFMNGEDSYHYHPMIGAPLDFFFEGSEVRVKRLKEEVVLSRGHFIQYASYVDLCFSRIYPLGSVVELDRDLLPQDLVAAFESEQMDFFVVLSGRRVVMETGSYIDYIGYTWPFGLRFDTAPLFVSNLFIKRVVSEGYTDMTDERYCQEAFRREYFNEGIVSSVYVEEIVNED
ncbi:DUF4176 domain-containing protein [Streptococcus cristatus]|jgi:hypothetical protein|uniref:DUF4176 domain-containing protein n=1 Tax=Streptococcus cristatus TaxID=45634 RepID=A0A428AN39_STRCR|nr:DUF4176 domain-containing protein [Streptococcus cristatus]RSI44309.1 hypothetical protein D8872_03395 [Streptococcus cristatus]